MGLHASISFWGHSPPQTAPERSAGPPLSLVSGASAGVRISPSGVAHRGRGAWGEGRPQFSVRKRPGRTLPRHSAQRRFVFPPS